VKKLLENNPKSLLHLHFMSQIEGVEIKELKTFPDNRGFFREIIRVTDPFFAEGFAQWSHSKMVRNTVKAWHFHKQQSDFWYCPLGDLEVVLYDNRESSPTYKSKMEFTLGDVDGAKDYVIQIPPMVIHGCKVKSDFAHLFYITTKTYNPNDEGRLPYNSNLVPHDWKIADSEAIVSVRDRRTILL